MVVLEVQYKGFQDRTGKTNNVSIFNLVTGSIIRELMLNVLYWESNTNTWVKDFLYLILKSW